MSLEQWLAARWLARHTPSQDEIRDLLAVADRELADAQVSGLSAEGAFAHAYAAALTSAAAALIAAGYQVERGVSHHHYIIESLEYTLALDRKTIARFDRFRRKRNVSIYDRPEAPSEADTAAMLAMARDLRRRAEEWIGANHPELL